MRTRVKWASAVVALAASFSMTLPASALPPPVTPDDLIAGIGAAYEASTATLLGEGGQSECVETGGSTVVSVVRPKGFSLARVSNGVATPFIAGTKKGIRLGLNGIRYLVNADPVTIAEVLAQAKVPPGTQYVSGPWGTATARYLLLTSDNPAQFLSIDGFRELGVELMLPEAPAWLSQAGVTANKIVSPDGSVTWKATRKTGPDASEEFNVVVTPEGRVATTDSRWFDKGVMWRQSTCTLSNYGAPGSLILPPAAKTAPILKVGPAAWKYVVTEALEKAVAETKKKVVADQDLTVKAVRAKAYVSVYALGYEDVITISNIAGGARLEASDPIAGTVARCVTLKNGTLKSGVC